MFKRACVGSLAWGLALAFAFLGGCGGRVSQMPPATDWQKFAIERTGASGATGLQWRSEVCANADLHADYRTLNETNLVAFLQDHHLETRVERQPVEANKPSLVFVFVTVPGRSQAVPLRVAVLPSSDEAGRDLYEALLQRGAGAWGVHRANLAVLGPVGEDSEDLQFAAETRLACWGTFTFASGGDAVVVPGGYAEP